MGRLIEVSSRHLSGWTEDNHFSQNVPAEARTENLPNIYKSRSLSLDLSSRSSVVYLCKSVIA
jgi:hypothetical protein